jgi:hypothetical protein
MATLSQKVAAEQTIREMVESGELPAPDRIEYGCTCIRAFWNEAKVCLRIDIDEDPDFDYGTQTYDE